MKFLFIENFLNSDVPSIIINVFLHSLWQGAVLCVIAWLSMKSSQKWSVQARYNLLVFFLFAFAAGIFVTFIYQLTGSRELTANAAASVTPAVSSISETRFFQSILQWFHWNATWIFLGWCIVFLFKANQIIRNLMAIERLRHFGAQEVTCSWKDRFNELRVSLGIKRRVILSESNLIRQPFVVGALKPLVLVPIGFLNGLDPKEVEAILLHELAHVRRNDYLVNLMQSLLETIFFFNPFVYWLSALVRNEREHCCDAIAIDHSGSKKTFINALLSVQERVQLAPYAMAFAGAKSQLVQRVDRIISSKFKHVSTMEKVIVSASYILLLITLASFSFLKNKTTVPEQDTTKAITHPVKSTPISTDEIKKEKVVPVVERDTIPKNASKEFIAGYNAGKNYRPGTSTTATDSVKKRIEQHAAAAVTTQINQADESHPTGVVTDGKEKKRIEMALVATRKSSD